MVQGDPRMVDHVVTDAPLSLHLPLSEHLVNNLQRHQRQHHGGNLPLELRSLRHDVHTLER